MAKSRTAKSEMQPETFEKALGELAEIVSDLEDGSIGLEESLARFEDGMRLLRRCHEVLGKAEQRIVELTGFDANGNPVTKPLDGTATIDQQPNAAGRRQRSSKESATSDDDDEAGPRLF